MHTSKFKFRQLAYESARAARLMERMWLLGFRLILKNLHRIYYEDVLKVIYYYKYIMKCSFITVSGLKDNGRSNHKLYWYLMKDKDNNLHVLY